MQADVSPDRGAALGSVRWHDLPSGGVLEVRQAANPRGLALELEVIISDGKTRWLWLLGTGQALAFVRAGQA